MVKGTQKPSDARNGGKGGGDRPTRPIPRP